MKVSYDGLWKLLIDKKMNKTDLKNITNIGSATLAKLSKGEPVDLVVLMKICKALNCELGAICCFVEENND